MNKVHLTLVQGHPQAPMVRHLVESYAKWWSLDLQITEESTKFWELKGAAHSIGIAAIERHLVPASVEFLLVRLADKNFYLPLPSDSTDPTLQDSSVKPTASFASLAKGEEPMPLPVKFDVDLLCFLGGQLWRAEELEPELFDAATQAEHRGFLGDRFGFFDWPVVDLWMRILLEHIVGHALPSPKAWQDPEHPEPTQAYPRFWMTYDVDCLRKWKFRSVVKHALLFPSYVIASRTMEWGRTLIEALKSHFPEQDPWYTIPQMLVACKNLTGTFFWLGHDRDHLSERYDIEKPEYASLVHKVRDNHHVIALHGSPLHAEDPAGLSLEKRRLERIASQPITICRQHFLKMVPGRTMRLLDRIGILLDSSMGFNARTGFRCGSAIPLSWWDFESKCALQIQELPLLAGDWTLHDPLQFDAIASRHRIWDLADRVRLGGGILTLDFHEIYFAQGDYPGHADFHQSVLEGLWMRKWRDWTPQ